MVDLATTMSSARVERGAALAAGTEADVTTVDAEGAADAPAETCVRPFLCCSQNSLGTVTT